MDDDGAGTISREDWHELRAARLALDVLMAHMPTALADSGAGAGLWQLHDRLCQLETGALARTGIPRCHLVIRPVCLMNPPGPEIMERITEAVRTLAELGMLTELWLAGPGGADLGTAGSTSPEAVRPWS